MPRLVAKPAQIERAFDHKCDELDQRVQDDHRSTLTWMRRRCAYKAMGALYRMLAQLCSPVLLAIARPIAFDALFSSVLDRQRRACQLSTVSRKSARLNPTRFPLVRVAVICAAAIAADRECGRKWPTNSAGDGLPPRHRAVATLEQPADMDTVASGQILDAGRITLQDSAIGTPNAFYRLRSP